MSGVDDRAGAVDGPATAPEAGELPVAPVLVRDYRRLLRLFPYTYRREHEAEMLGHLLDGAAPGQARPSRAERWDLLRAAAREWLLAPLGSTARQRRASTSILAAVLLVLLAFPIGRSLGSASLTLTDPGLRHLTLVWSPTAPTWALWAVACTLLLAGRLRAFRAVGTVGVCALLATLALLAVQGQWHDVSRELGWLTPTTALLVVAGWLGGRTPHVPRRILVAVAFVGVGVVEGLRRGAAAFLLTEWTPATVSVSLWALGMAAPMVLMAAFAFGGLLLHDPGRQSLPVALGVLAGLWVGRFGVLDRSPLNGPDPDVLLPQVVAVVVVMASARWVVNRTDELVAARAEGRRGAVRSQAPRPGEPTAV